MRLLSIILTSTGFLFFALEVSKLIFHLKQTTDYLVNQFNVSNTRLNERSYQLAGYVDSKK
jgi:hypothetical protein